MIEARALIGKKHISALIGTIWEGISHVFRLLCNIAIHTLFTLNRGTLCNIKHPSAFKSKNPDDICHLSLLTRECTRSVIAYLFLCKCIYGHNHGRSQGNALDAEDK